MNGTKGGEIMDLLNVEKGRTIDLGLTREHKLIQHDNKLELGTSYKDEIGTKMKLRPKVGN